MLIQHSGNIIREVRFDEIKSGPWQIKEFYDAATIGIELIWPYPSYNRQAEPPDGVLVESVSKEFFAITFPSHIRIQEGCSLFLYPHYSTYLANGKKNPLAITQSIEFDWWPGPLCVIFADRKCVFQKDKPFAQGLVIPRRDYTVKGMPHDDIVILDEANQFIENNGDKYITRQNNLYARLSQLNKSEQLPEEIKKSMLRQNKRVLWN
jgi:hypothetical protein